MLSYRITLVAGDSNLHFNTFGRSFFVELLPFVQENKRGIPDQKHDEKEG
jgi:hypothetical protein